MTGDLRFFKILSHPTSGENINNFQEFNED